MNGAAPTKARALMMRAQSRKPMPQARRQDRFAQGHQARKLAVVPLIGKNDGIQAETAPYQVDQK